MKFKINESKTFEFEIDTMGVSSNELEGYFRLNLEGIEYGFPLEIKENGIKVNIPVFKDILHEDVRTSLYENKEVKVKARIDLVANNEVYISPWNGDIDIEIPVSVKLIEGKKSPKIKITNLDENNPEESRKEKKSRLMNALVELDLTESVGEKNKKIEEKQDNIDTDKKKY